MAGRGERDDRPAARAALRVGAATSALLVVAILAVNLAGGSRPEASVEPVGPSLSPASPPFASPSEAMAAAPACTRTVELDSSGTDDVTTGLQRFIAASPNGSVICLARGGSYRVEGGLHLENRTDLTIEGRGARIFATTRSRVPRILIDKGGSGITVRELTIEGFWPQAGTTDAADRTYESNHGIALGGTRDVEIGPNVQIRNVAGDGVYVTSGGPGSAVAWSERVHVHHSTIELTGRMGVSVTDGGRDVTVDHNEFDKIALYVLDLEPNGVAFDGVPAGADRVRFSDNVIGTYGVSPLLASWMAAGTGKGPETNIEISRNIVNGGALRIGAWDVGGSVRANFRIVDNWSAVTVAGPTMMFEGIDGLTVSGNTQPLSSGQLMMVRNSRLVSPAG